MSYQDKQEYTTAEIPPVRVQRIVGPRLDAKEREIIRACQHFKTDLFGDSAERTVRVINSHAGCPLSEVAQWNVILDIVRKLTAKRPNDPDQRPGANEKDPKND